MKAPGVFAAALVMLASAGPAARAGPVSDWVEADGVAELAGGTTVEQARTSALNKARSRAITQITGITISDEAFMGRTGEGALKLFRETRSLVAGRVVAEKVLAWSTEAIQPRPDEPPVPLLRVKLQVRVAADDPPDPSFKVQLRLPKRRFMAGEALVMELQASQDAYAMVFSLGADDKVRPVIPNEYRTDLLLTRNRPQELPTAQDAFEIKPMPVPGHSSDVEAIKVVATRTRVAAPEVGKTGTISMADFYRWLLAIPARDRSEITEEYMVYATGDAAR